MVSNTTILYVSSYVMGVLSFFFGVFAIVEKNKFTPIYRDIWYASGKMEVQGVVASKFESTIAKAFSSITGPLGSAVGGITSGVTGIFGGMSGGDEAPDTGGETEEDSYDIDHPDKTELPNVELLLPLQLWNPNPYHVVFKPTGRGSAWLATRDAHIAYVQPREGKIAEGPGGDEYTESLIEVDILTQLNVADFIAVLKRPDVAFSTEFGTVIVLYEYFATLVIQPKLFFWRASVEVELAPKCKQKMPLFGGKSERAECGKTWEDIGYDSRRLAAAKEDTPPAGHGIPEGSRNAKVEKEQLEKAQGMVDMGLGGLAAMGILTAIALFAAPFAHHFYRKRQEERKAAAEGEAAADDNRNIPAAAKYREDKSFDDIIHEEIRPQPEYFGNSAQYYGNSAPNPWSSAQLNRSSTPSHNSYGKASATE
mmetsp:Transcript_78699/g.228435  ORF Transcript_78699/g.228435 Transcript_78699/m.228435 type:complete len:424 (-) Transcript_78699:129-1400(-)|eukprot:CAMPEP_0176019664 /NCGR_PEP_ID=MMETSP0120_2-20121206/9506_1 /TAXON_ID=160619 /ORGANISM="Kryptoperidinium foliaceum, Strain CCMP 1326" /LENGTH=423 /DNA_ID=CAMNT_0017352745 /DNA_START=70 /DNA_END=1341 /DNA_ORIENTATION=-